MKSVRCLKNGGIFLSSIELPNVQVSDTTDDDSSNTAGPKKSILLFLKKYSKCNH